MRKKLSLGWGYSEVLIMVGLTRSFFSSLAKGFAIDGQCRVHEREQDSSHLHMLIWTEDMAGSLKVF